MVDKVSAERGELTSRASRGKEEYKRLAARRASFLIVCGALIFILIGASLSMGSAQVSFVDAYSAILGRLFPGQFQVESLVDVVVWHLRLPRTLMAVLCGAILGIAGCTTMAVLRNPLATPYTIGVSSSAGLGAAIAIILSKGLLAGNLVIVGNAFTLSLVPVAVIVIFSKRTNASPQSMILMGVAMNYIFSACNTLLQFVAEAEAVRATVFWLVGDLARSSWWQLPYVAGALALSLLINLRLASDLNIAKIGDDQAKALGVEVERVRRITLLIACLATATVVSFTGAIGFVCLLSPHICRFIVGGDERHLIPASGLFGAVLLLTSDIIARRAAAPVMLPVGAVTAIMGGPLLIYLLTTRK
ncbi:MAG: iron ABC transporter permease [Thermoproteota archaeon]